MKKPAGQSGQMPLALPMEPAITREDLLESPTNRLAVDLVDRWPDWPSNCVILAGPVGSGKSHLAQVWANSSGANTVMMSDLAGTPNIAPIGNLVLENANAGEIDEESLFHTFNQVKASGNFILITSRSFPLSWGISLPDLVSRLKLAHVVELQEPDDQLLSGLIFKLFADRQLEVSPKVVAYLVTRMERSMEVAGKLVDWLDKEALARHQKINRAMAGEALAAFDMV